MHFLRDLCERTERDLPQLRRRAGTPAAAPAEALIRRRILKGAHPLADPGAAIRRNEYAQ
jgi:hypothetical protein